MLGQMLGDKRPEIDELHGIARFPIAALVAHFQRQQMRLMPLVAAGELNKTIAWKMELSVRTVEEHRRRIFERLHVHSAAELATLLAQARAIGVPLFPKEAALVPARTDARLHKQLVLKGDDAARQIVAEFYLEPGKAPVGTARWERKPVRIQRFAMGRSSWSTADVSLPVEEPRMIVAFSSPIAKRSAGVDAPTVLFYPGELDGAAGLKFMGVLQAEHNYRPKIL